MADTLPPTPKLVFIAGPYRSPDGHYGTKLNIDQALDCARAVWERGDYAVCPHGNCYMMSGDDIPEDAFLDGALRLLSRCEAIVLLPGWEKSAGTRTEVQAAVDQDIPMEFAQRESAAKPKGCIPRFAWVFTKVNRETIWIDGGTE